VLHTDLHLVQQVMEMKVAEHVRKAETRRLIRQVRGGQPTWLVRAACWLLGGAGSTLVLVGQWLQTSAARRWLSLDPAQSLGHE
jgi:hypothetical protein